AFSRIGPASADMQQTLGAVYYRRGWLERGLERYRMAATLDDRDIDARIGQVETLLDLHRAEQATPLHDSLVATRPRNVHVQRMDTYHARHTGWQFAATADRGRSHVRGNALASPSPMGNRDGDHAFDVQSPLLGNRWRLTAHTHDRWADFSDAAAGGVRVHDRRIGAGVRYENDKLDLRAYATRPNDRWSNDTGFGVEANWRLSDVLNGELLARRADPDASLQARRSGITGDRIAVGLNYVPSERTTLSTAAEHWRYSDGNRREVFGAQLDQRLLSRPHLLLNGLVEAYAGRGSRDDAPYFNPGSDGSLKVGLRVDHLAWRRYERHFRHRISVMAGPYWQEGFGSAIVPSARYEHEWSFGLGSTLVYGADWSRPVYDGVREQRLGFDIGFYWGTDR
ncbi:MAG: poly-beta-1,6 N-acetyl-D-glucosamine export porin PgaA, partial [Luteimonas sp.]